MSITNKLWTFASLGVALVIATLFLLGGHYSAVLVLFLPLGFWLSLKQEPSQANVRPWIKVLGWLLVGFSLLAIIASAIAFATGK